MHGCGPIDCMVAVRSIAWLRSDRLHAYGSIDCMLAVRSIACLRSDRLHAYGSIDCMLAVRSIACSRSDRFHARGPIDCMRVTTARNRVQENQQGGQDEPGGQERNSAHAAIGKCSAYLTKKMHKGQSRCSRCPCPRYTACRAGELAVS